MQDVDSELVYHPGKDEADPLDFLSRHPLPETGDDQWNVNAEHAVVVTQIREETQKDEIMQELSVAEGLIFREHRTVLPPTLHRKVVKLGRSLGHLGKTKTKQMLKEKYWFPLMNSMIDTEKNQSR